MVQREYNGPDHGNKQHDRLALPMSDEWWIAVDGEKRWPRAPRPRVVSHCLLDDNGIPRPAKVSDEERTLLEKLGVSFAAV